MRRPKCALPASLLVVGAAGAWYEDQLIIRSSEGTLRAAKNLCTGSLIEAVRDQTKTVDLKQVNTVLLHPHWRHNQTGEPQQPILIAPPSSALKS